jgi:hypothetical protein
MELHAMLLAYSNTQKVTRQNRIAVLEREEVTTFECLKRKERHTYICFFIHTSMHPYMDAMFKGIRPQLTFSDMPRRSTDLAAWMLSSSASTRAIPGHETDLDSVFSWRGVGHATASSPSNPAMVHDEGAAS